MIITDETMLVFTIKPLKGRSNLEPFKVKFSFDEFENEGIAQYLVDEGYFEFMTHPCEYYEIIKREII
jgi:hypothetical protein